MADPLDIAGLPTFNIPPAADPIFAAIARQKTTRLAMEKSDWRDRDRFTAVNNADEEAYERLINTVPTTAAGFRAFIEYLAYSDVVFDEEASATALESLLRSPFLADA